MNIPIVKCITGNGVCSLGGNSVALQQITAGELQRQRRIQTRYRRIIFCVDLLQGDRFVGRRGANQGLDPHDVAVIYDIQGNLICESGVFLDIIFEYGGETGVGIAMGEWDDEKMVVLGGCWVIDKNGNKLSGEYDRIGKNADGTYTAYYDGHTKTHILDMNGKIVE